MANIRPEIQALVTRGNVTKAEWEKLRINSAERDALVPNLTIEALVSVVEHALDNCDYREADYNGAVINRYAPIMIQKLEAASEVIETLVAYGEAIVQHEEAVAKGRPAEAVPFELRLLHTRAEVRRLAEKLYMRRLNREYAVKDKLKKAGL